MLIEFLDFPSKAKELGITEGVLRSRVLSGQFRAYCYVAGDTAMGSHDSFLPPWDSEHFSLTDWQDHGSSIDRVTSYEEVRGIARKEPRYTLSGWVQMDQRTIDEVLTGSTVNLHQNWVGVISDSMDLICPLVINGRRQWVLDGGKDEDGRPTGFHEERATTVSRTEIYFPAGEAVSKLEIEPRKEASLLRTIAAMLDLLLAKDGGAFPSQAKVIDQLVDRYGTAEGVSKRTLEKVFPDATRIAGNFFKAQGLAPQLTTLAPQLR